MSYYTPREITNEKVLAFLNSHKTFYTIEYVGFGKETPEASEDHILSRESTIEMINEYYTSEWDTISVDGDHITLNVDRSGGDWDEITQQLFEIYPVEVGLGMQISIIENKIASLNKELVTYTDLLQRAKDLDTEDKK